MKIRIKGNSVRYRLTKTDVKNLSTTGYLEDCTSFGSTEFKYALQTAEGLETLSATYLNNRILVLAPLSFAKDWPSNEIISLGAQVTLTGSSQLYLLIEKDYACLDHTDEDQADQYENPNKTC